MGKKTSVGDPPQAGNTIKSGIRANQRLAIKSTKARNPIVVFTQTPPGTS